MRFINIILLSVSGKLIRDFYLALTFSVLLLEGCGSNASTQLPFSLATPTITVTEKTTSNPNMSPVATSNPSASTTSGSLAKAQSPTITDSQDWQRRWIEGNPCKAPCFEGITPGVTNLSQAIQILDQNPLVTAVQVLPSSGSKHYLGWDWVSRPRTSIGVNPTGGVAQEQELGGVIKSIAPSLPKKFELGDLIKTYGEPSHVLASATLGDAGTVYYIYYIYLERGLKVKGFNSKKPENISVHSEVSMPIFFIPGMTGLQGLFPFQNLNIYLFEWQGFKDFGFYCRHPNYGVNIPNCTKLE